MSKLKQAAQLYWMVKGHIPPFLHQSSDKELSDIIDSYFFRMWGNEESNLHKEGFEEAWNRFNQ